MRSYDFAGYHFSAQKDLNAATKEAIRCHPLDMEFTDDLLLAIINNLHPEVTAAKQRATKLKLLSYSKQLELGLPTAQMYRGGVLMMGWFEPLRQWRDVSVYPWKRSKDKKQLIKRALRDILSKYLPHPTNDDRCAVSGCTCTGYSLEYDHVRPTFAVISDRCLQLMSTAEIDTLFGYDKFSDSGKSSIADYIPQDHMAIKVLLDAHKFNEWRWLCKFHHRGIGWY